MDKPTGGAAFPIVYENGSTRNVHRGMTLRDWFAGQALAEAYRRAERIAENAERPIEAPVDLPSLVARAVYLLADAMLKERDK